MKKNICLLLIAALMCSCAGQDNGKDAVSYTHLTLPTN